MKRPTVASLKRVNTANLEALGVERLASILLDVAQARPDLKRRLRMELAATQGADHLIAEIDKRLGSLETSRSKIGWRQRPVFVRDLDALRTLIAKRLSDLDRASAIHHLWRLLGAGRSIGPRLKDREGTVMAVLTRAAEDLGGLLSLVAPTTAAADLIGAISQHPTGWVEWLGPLLGKAPPSLAAEALTLIGRGGATPLWATLVRQLADTAGDVDAFIETYTAETLATPTVAAEVARRLMTTERLEEAGLVLEAAAGPAGRAKRPAPVDFQWETTWIDYHERVGEKERAQEQRWALFERTLAVGPARAFTSRLPDFEDVEAEGRAFVYAARHPDFDAGLAFLMAWPALPEAAQMILSRPGEVDVPRDNAELWAAKLRVRQPAAARLLLRRAAAAAFRRREFKTCDRLTTKRKPLRRTGDGRADRLAAAVPSSRRTSAPQGFRFRPRSAAWSVLG